jgi:hypothetical protein
MKMKKTYITFKLYKININVTLFSVFEIGTSYGGDVNNGFLTGFIHLFSVLFPPFPSLDFAAGQEYGSG